MKQCLQRSEGKWFHPRLLWPAHFSIKIRITTDLYGFEKIYHTLSYKGASGNGSNKKCHQIKRTMKGEWQCSLLSKPQFRLENPRGRPHEGQTWGELERDERSAESRLKANAGCSLSPSRPIDPYCLLCPVPWGTSDSHEQALVLPTFFLGVI